MLFEPIQITFSHGIAALLLIAGGIAFWLAVVVVLAALAWVQLATWLGYLPKDRYGYRPRDRVTARKAR